MSSCVNGTLCFELAKGIPTAILALIAVLITYRQYQVAKAKVKLDLFDKRLKLFHDLRGLLESTARVGTIETSKIYPSTSNIKGHWATPFENLLYETSFLFGTEVYGYVALCSQQYALLSARTNSLQHMGDQILSDDNIRLGRDWFRVEADSNCGKHFREYLDFTEWK